MRQQCEHLLRRAVRRGQHAGAGLGQNLGAGQVGRFSGEVRVANLLSLLVTFSSATFNEFTLVFSVSVSNAPRRPRKSATWVMASSMIWLALAAFPPTSVDPPPVTMSLRNPAVAVPKLAGRDGLDADAHLLVAGDLGRRAGTGRRRR